MNPTGGLGNYVSSGRSGGGYDHSGDSVRSGTRTSAILPSNKSTGSSSNRPYLSSRVSGFFGAKRSDSIAATKHSIPRSTFVEYYPQFLIDVTTNFDVLQKTQSAKFNFGVTTTDGDDDNNDGQPPQEASVDICFQELCLSVKVAGKSINVVDNVTGRIREKTMTALMGGSGAGKYKFCLDD